MVEGDVLSAETPTGNEFGLEGSGHNATTTGGAPQAKAEQSGIGEYARVLWRRKWIVVITFVVVVVAVLGYCSVASKSYTATATVFLEPPVSSMFSSSQGVNPTVSLVNVPDAIQIMESSTISNLVAKTIPNPPAVSAVQVGSLDTTDVVQMSASSTSPQTAAAAANAYANAYISYEKGITKSTYSSAEKQVSGKLDTLQLAISDLTAQIRSAAAGVNLTAQQVQLSDLETQLTSLQNQLQEYQFYATQGTKTEVGNVLSEATVPTSPSSPKTTEYVVIAAIVGLILGIGLALLVNAVSTRRV